MDKYNLIIIILIVILGLLYLWLSLKQNNEGFTSQFDEENGIFGNLLYSGNQQNNLFDKQYRITGIYVTISNGNKYKLKINNSYVSYSDNIELNSGKYYDISDLNIKSKSVEITHIIGSVSSVKIYGLNDYNIMNKPNYDAATPITNFSINNTDKTILFNNDLEYLVSYIKLPISTTNYNIKYKNQFTNSAFVDHSSDIKDLTNKYHKESNKIYFDRPLLASEIKLESYTGSLTTNNINVYGKLATESDVKTYKLESEIENENNDKNVVLDGMKCPPMKDIITRQKLINDLCNSIGEKDKIRNHQTNYEKTKKYIGKLKQQETQIQELKLKLRNLMKDNENTSLSFQEQVAAIEENINNFNIADTLDKIDINYITTPTTTQSS